MLATEAPFPQYFDLDGEPLDGGRLYFGVVNQNPETAPIVVYWDAAGTQPAAQPIRTLNGYSVRSGSPAAVYAASDYSLSLRDQRGQLVYYAASSVAFSNDFALLALIATFSSTASAAEGAGLVGFNAQLNYVAGTAGFKLLERLSLFDVMTAAEIADYKAGTLAIDISTKVQLAYNLARTVWHPKGKAYIGTTAISIPSNTTLEAEAGFEFRFNSSVPAAMPQAYFPITGSNVKISGIYLNMVANPFVSYTPTGIGWQLRDNVSNVEITGCRTNLMLHAVHGIHTGGTTAQNVSKINIHHNNFFSADTDVYFTGRSPVNFQVCDNVFDGARPNYLRNGGAVYIGPAVALENPAVFNQTDYDTYCGQQIVVSRNIITAGKGRTIRVHNSQRVEIDGNVMSLPKNTYVGQLSTDDTITMDMLRRFSCRGNIIEGGGENGIDFLSCQDGVIADNVVKQTDTDGIYGYISDLWVSSGSSPKLNGITDRQVLNNKNVVVSDNEIEAFVGIYVGAGQNVKVCGNLLKAYRGTTNRTSAAGEPLPLVLDINAGAAYFTESESHWSDDIHFTDNRPVLIGPVRVTASAASDTFTTVGGVPHRFATGDRIEPVAGGASNTVDFPGGLDYKTEYFAIVTGATTFQIATSWVNAFAGTAVNITSDGLATANARLYFREAVPNTSVSVSASYYSVRHSITLDENIPGHWAANLFSTLPVISPGTAFLFKNSKHQFIWDPAVNYGVTRDALDKYFPVPAVAYNGTFVFGISPYSLQPAGYQFATGTRPANTLGSPADGYIKTTLW